MDITINGQALQFNMQSWWGPMYIYEEVMDVANHPERKFNPAKTLYLHIMLYCVLMDDNPGITLTLEEFLKAIENLDLRNTLLEYYNKRVEIILDIQPGGDKEADKPSKKKSSRRMTHTKES